MFIDIDTVIRRQRKGTRRSSLFIGSLEAVGPITVSRIEEASFLLEIVRPRIAESGIVETSTS